MKRLHLLPMVALSLLVLFVGAALAMEKEPAAEETSIQLTAGTQDRIEALDLPADLSAALLSPDVIPATHAECNDFCFAQATQCTENCAGNTACEQACADAELCCNCDCGAIPAGACRFFGCPGF